MTNVLADRHHSGLYHSFQLMGARFGWKLYAPAGMDWWDADYWAFGRSTYADDRLARQFLVDIGTDGEFPDWPISSVTLEQARTMDWAYVIATVPDNEQGFHRFAQETGAQYVVQIGNTGQYIDWSLDPIVLNSSEMPMVGRGVRYHQPMDPVPFADPEGAFRYGRPIASFVNCMPSMGSCWDAMQRFDRHVDVYGIDGPRGIIKPYSEMVATMATYAWAWHDKAQGDGFGHVLHTWAAVGRPLIGHASHYEDKIGAHFWRDMETCIDLDRHRVEHLQALLESITPEKHREMCLAIRAEFDSIAWDTEAAAIAGLLGLIVVAA